LPREVKILFKIFDSQIRLVGGCVRDLLMNKKVNDFDFACKLLPQEIIEILHKNKVKFVPTGIKFGTITAVLNGKNFEITTLRKDEEENGRYCKPEFINDYFLDAARRDFTINALYLDSAGFVYDYFNGISDLKKQKVRFIGDANKRISEDYLRILRFFRFSCEYGKNLDIKGLAACVAQKENLKKLSRERVRNEFLKIISSKKEENLTKILQTLKNKKIFQELFLSKIQVNALKKIFLLEKKLKITASLNLKIAALFLTKKVNLEIFFQEFCATNLEKKYLKFLLSKSFKSFDLSDLKELLVFKEKSLVLDLYLLSSSNLKKNSQLLFLVKKNILFLQNFILPKFPLSAKDFIDLGFREKALGQAIFEVKKFWAKNDFSLKKIHLKKFLKLTFKSHKSNVLKK
jgi:poly(A) polymerase